ncbi:MAG: hypothetical protein JSU01_24225 [Bacteroidetes bacterium]|nr:hypothetical protein [Bacteroidota bacterium]
MAGLKTYKILIIAILFTGLASCFSDGYAQVLPNLQNDFAAYQQSNLREKLFVHINKNFYESGEILWFKVYCVDAANNKPLGLSKVAYIELIDGNHTPVVQTMVALKDGSGSGSVFLPFSLNSGHFIFRAYTSWMKNFDPGYFFQSRVTVFNPRKPVAEATPVTSGIDIQFFPEGGHLVQGLSSKVAFKMIGSDGKGVAGNGVVVTSHGDTAVKFSALKFGMGSFMFTPKVGESYRALVKINNQVLTKDLPHIDESGYVLQVTDEGSQWKVHIQSSGDDRSKPVYLMLHNNYSIKQAEEVHLDQQGSATVMISKSKPDEGISYITLFDAQRPVCERMIFKRPTGKLLINARADQPVYETRKKVNIAISASDESNQSPAADLSVSVFRADGLQDTDPGHISGYLWLRAALKGNIESPDYYLENTDKQADEALDNLLLSQGWTQFDWSKVTAGIAPKFKFLPEYTGPIITGRVTDITNNKLVAGLTAYLTINGNPQKLYVAQSDSTGRVLFNVQNFYGPHELVAQANGTVDSIYRIDIQTPFAEAVAGGRLAPLDLNPDARKMLLENSVNMQVQNIFSGDQVKQFYKPAIDSTWFFGQPGKSYKLDDYTRFTTMEEVLREYVVSIGVAKHQGKFVIHMFDGDRLIGDPLVLIDGVPVFDADKLFKWDPLKIKRLDMVTHDYLYGPDLFHGIMSFTTYKDDGASFEIDPHAVVLDYDGLQQERKFYSPVYDSDAPRNSTIPDFRTALYWNPNVNTDANGKSSLSFYTSDKAGRYVGIIEGITADGKSGSKVFTFEVKK